MLEPSSCFDHPTLLKKHKDGVFLLQMSMCEDLHNVTVFQEWMQLDWSESASGSHQFVTESGQAIAILVPRGTQLNLRLTNLLNLGPRTPGCGPQLATVPS